MARFYITGGKQRISHIEQDEWNQFEEARLAELDTDTGQVEVRLKHKTRVEWTPKGKVSHIFKSGSWHAGDLLLVTQTEIIRVDTRDFTVKELISHPWFNDLHHVVFRDKNYWVASTGIDCLIRLERSGELKDVRHALFHDPWEHRSPHEDYRKWITTKPHKSHPNYVFHTEKGVWLTRFEQHDAICLDEPSLRVPIDVGRPHDGILYQNFLWFTTVNGFLVKADQESGEVVRRYDLNRFEPKSDRPLGWCRGLAFADGIALVGFSRLRHTKLRQNLSWLKQGFKTAAGYRTLPTRVAAYDLEGAKLLHQWNIESAGLNAMFSILKIE